MIFKAATDFRNTHKLKIDGRKEGDLHVAKGDTFEADLSDVNTAQLIAILGVHGCIIDVENQPVSAKRIDDEVAALKKKNSDASKVATTPKPNS